MRVSANTSFFNMFLIYVILMTMANKVHTQEMNPPKTLNCTFTHVDNPVEIILTNDCGKHAKIRTCPEPFSSCVGYMGSPNHYVDCPIRIENNETRTLLLDNTRSYILIDCPDWWPPKGAGIDNWWTVSPIKKKWPETYYLPPWHNKTKV